MDFVFATQWSPADRVNKLNVFHIPLLSDWKTQTQQFSPALRKSNGRSDREEYRCERLNCGYSEHEVSETKAGTQSQEATRESTIEVPLSKEEVKVGKRTVGAGEVKLHKTVTTEQVNVPVELKREDVVVERVPAQEIGTGKEAFQEEVIKVPLSREEPVVEKEVHVTGGVRVRKTEGVDKETIRETVRREEVDVDESGKTTRLESGTGEEYV